MKTSLKEKIDLILNSETPFDFIHKGHRHNYKCSGRAKCKNKAKYLTYSSYFKLRPVIRFMCGQCLCDAQHAGHEGSSIEGVLLSDIPKKQWKRIYAVLSMSSIFIMLSQKRRYKNLEKSFQKIMFGQLANNNYFKNRIKEHAKTYKTMSTLLEYNKENI